MEKHTGIAVSVQIVVKGLNKFCHTKFPFLFKELEHYDIDSDSHTLDSLKNLL